jgi:hypothetical protein
MTETIVQTPFDFSEPVRAGRRRFWKQVLPVTSIDYKGQKVDFDPQFHMDLAQSFKDEAFDQVPVVFADSENRHNMDPRNFGGDVLDMQYRGPGKGEGTWALIEADRDAAKAIRKNPKLGVSARIRQMIEKSDGRKFNRAIEHICLTMNPRVTGMEAWQAVDLSAEDADIEVVDLTAANYQEGKPPMGTKTTKTPRRTASGKIDLSALDDEQFQTLLDLAETALAPNDEDEDEEVEDEDADLGEVENPSTLRKTRKKKSKTKITVEKESEDDEDDDEEEEEDEESTDLTDAEKVTVRSTVSTVRQMQIDLAEEKWARERDGLLSDGVPAFLLDLAEPVLSQPEAMTIDLSDDESINATDTIRKMLEGVKGIIDLTGEVGHAFDLSEEASDSTQAFLDEWDKQYG